jgi:hypothetical protein
VTTREQGDGDGDGDGQQGGVQRDEDSSRLHLTAAAARPDQRESDRANERTKGGVVVDVAKRSEGRRPSRWEALGQ